MDRKEHLEWCKTRALEYLAHGDIPNAITSMMSDLEKHPETKGINPALSAFGILTIQNRDFDGARRFIEGFR